MIEIELRLGGGAMPRLGAENHLVAQAFEGDAITKLAQPIGARGSGIEVTLVASSVLGVRQGRGREELVEFCRRPVRSPDLASGYIDAVMGVRPVTRNAGAAP